MMASAGLLYLALFALAARMNRHRAVLLGPWQRRAFVPHLALAGWLLLALSLAGLWATADAGMALVEWIGLLALLSGGVTLCITYAPGVARAGVAAALALVLTGLASGR
jgi:hypothetical protein